MPAIKRFHTQPRRHKLSRVLPVYKSYNFIGKDPIIFELEDAMNAEGFTPKKIHEKGGATANTLNRMFYGKTQRPYITTIRASLRAMGCDLRVVHAVRKIERVK